MTDGQFMDGGKCPCGTDLPKLEDKNHGWGLAICPRCKRAFDTDTYRAIAGGKFHTGTGCKCETCRELEG